MDELVPVSCRGAGRLAGHRRRDPDSGRSAGTRPHRSGRRVREVHPGHVLRQLGRPVRSGVRRRRDGRRRDGAGAAELRPSLERRRGQVRRGHSDGGGGRIRNSVDLGGQIGGLVGRLHGRAGPSIPGEVPHAGAANTGGARSRGLERRSSGRGSGVVQRLRDSLRKRQRLGMAPVEAAYCDVDRLGAHRQPHHRAVGRIGRVGDLDQRPPEPEDAVRHRYRRPAHYGRGTQLARHVHAVHGKQPVPGGPGHLPLFELHRLAVDRPPHQLVRRGLPGHDRQGA